MSLLLKSLKIGLALWYISNVLLKRIQILHGDYSSNPKPGQPEILHTLMPKIWLMKGWRNGIKAWPLTPSFWNVCAQLHHKLEKKHFLKEFENEKILGWPGGLVVKTAGYHMLTAQFESWTQWLGGKKKRKRYWKGTIVAQLYSTAPQCCTHIENQGLVSK